MVFPELVTTWGMRATKQWSMAGFQPWSSRLLKS